MLNNYNIQTGYLIDNDDKAFDVSVILNFPTEADYDNCTSLSDFPSVNLIDFYFGDTNDRDTEHYVNQFVEKQAKLRKLISTLIDLSTDENESEIAEQLEFVKSLIVDLH
jgi:hypothetical protein